MLCDGRSNTVFVETANLVEATVRRLSHSSNHGEGCVLVGYCVGRSVSGESAIDFAADGFAIASEHSLHLLALCRLTPKERQQAVHLQLKIS